MKILLFGSTGMLGTAAELICKKRDIELKGLSHEDIDITDKIQVAKMIKDNNPDVVFNSVSIIGTNPCEEDPLYAFKLNSIATYYMAKICDENGCIFVQPSSHAVFDGTKEYFYTEEDVVKPMGIYSSSKYMAEIYAMNLCRKHYVIRFPTMFGPRRNKRLGFVDKVIERIKNNQICKIADDKIDSMTYSLDAFDKVCDIIENNKPFGLYHIANSGKTSYYDFIEKLLSLWGIGGKLERAKDCDFQALGYKSLKTALTSKKLSSLRFWEDALKDYINDFLKKEGGNV